MTKVNGTRFQIFVGTAYRLIICQIAVAATTVAVVGFQSSNHYVGLGVFPLTMMQFANVGLLMFSFWPAEFTWRIPAALLACVASTVWFLHNFGLGHSVFLCMSAGVILMFQGGSKRGWPHSSR